MNNIDSSPLVAASKQPSHTLFVLSNALADQKGDFVKWPDRQTDRQIDRKIDRQQTQIDRQVDR